MYVFKNFSYISFWPLYEKWFDEEQGHHSGGFSITERDSANPMAPRSGWVN